MTIRGEGYRVSCEDEEGKHDKTVTKQSPIRVQVVSYRESTDSFVVLPFLNVLFKNTGPRERFRIQQFQHPTR